MLLLHIHKKIGFLNGHWMMSIFRRNGIVNEHLRRCMAIEKQIIFQCPETHTFLKLLIGNGSTVTRNLSMSLQTRKVKRSSHTEKIL
jgi:hypothetical protein